MDPLRHDRFIKKIRMKKEQYIKTSTIHGVPKIFTDCWIESCFWLCITIIGVSLSIFGASTLISKYYSYEIYTAFSSRIIEKNTFPSVTFCDYQLMLNNYYAYCGVRIGESHVNSTLPCQSMVRKFPEVKNILNSTNEWSNGIFHVNYCSSWGGKNCATDGYIKSLSKHNHTCFTWNHKGNYYDDHGHIDIKLNVNLTCGKNFSKLIAIVHDPKITELQLMFQTFLETSRIYQFQIQKTEMNRLKYPFPSNCTDEKPNYIFPGRYTRTSCVDSMNYIDMLKHCGDTFDYIKRYVPEDLLRMYSRNVTVTEAQYCMLNFSQRTINSTEACPVPCKEIEFSTLTSFHNILELNNSLYTVEILHSKFDSIKVIEERQLYTWDQIAGEVGGFLGLIIGVSFVSVVELLACFLLLVIEKVIELRKYCFL